VDELRATVPPGALLLAQVPGVGPKRALRIAGGPGVTSVAELDEAVRSGRLRAVAGFGPKSEERIHAPNLVMQRMTDEKMPAQREELRALAGTTGMALLNGTLRRLRGKESSSVGHDDGSSLNW